MAPSSPTRDANLGVEMTTKLLKRAKPVVFVERGASVMDAVRIMHAKRVGAVLVLIEDRPIGIFTERDLLTKVVLKKLDPETTKLSEVMTKPVVPISIDAELSEALAKMLEGHIRHLPVVDRDGYVHGMLSMRHVMREQIEHLERTVGSLTNYLGSDSPGG
jgi:CBS domain-containing protein